MVIMTGAGTEPVPQPAGVDPTPEDRLRAGTFRLLATLLAAPPDQELLARLAVAVGDETGDDALARAWAALRVAARQGDTDQIDDEYQQLFIGIGRGELVPYGSWYLTGFLMERPLGDLRRRLAELGLERDEKVREPEDHIAALFEVMALLITDGAYGVETERRFFGQHIAPWAERFLDDLEQAASARFYRSVGRLGTEFMALEQRCLTMIA